MRVPYYNSLLHRGSKIPQGAPRKFGVGVPYSLSLCTYDTAPISCKDKDRTVSRITTATSLTTVRHGNIKVTMAEALATTAATTAVTGAITSLVGKPISESVTSIIKKAILADQEIPQLSSQVFNDLNAMKKEFGLGVCTLVSIANMTGADMRAVRQQDFEGHTWKYPPPPSIGPGQVGVFLHGKMKLSAGGSKGAVVYTAKLPNGKEMYVLLAFDSPFHRVCDRGVYVDAKNEDDWPKLEKEWKVAKKSISQGERSIYARTFSPKRAEDGEKLGTDRKKLETESDEGKLEIRATIGQTYSPICQFIIGYPPELLEKFKEKEKQQERERIEEEREKSKQFKVKTKCKFQLSYKKK